MNIRICSPVHGDPRARFAHSLVALVIRSMKEGLAVTWGLQSSSSIINSRRALAEEALERGDDYLLWADADHSFPEDALLRLLSHRLDIVGINQPRRMLPTGPTTLGLDGTSIASLPIAGLVETCTPLQTLAEPADYTGPYVLLASKANSSPATGAVINCDGGLGVRGIGANAGGLDL